MTTNETETDKQLQPAASKNKQLFDEITIVLNKHQNKYELSFKMRDLLAFPGLPIKVPRVIMTALSAIVLLIDQNGM